MDQVDDEHPELGRKENSLKWPHMERVTRITKPYFNNGRTPKIERRKRMSISIPWETRGEREFVLNILTIERRTRHENSLLKLKRENYENFLRPRLPSRSEILLVHPV